MLTIKQACISSGQHSYLPALGIVPRSQERLPRASQPPPDSEGSDAETQKVGSDQSREKPYLLYLGAT
jgi:hypothetical protein